MNLTKNYKGNLVLTLTLSTIVLFGVTILASILFFILTYYQIQLLFASEFQDFVKKSSPIYEIGKVLIFNIKILSLLFVGYFVGKKAITNHWFYGGLSGLTYTLASSLLFLTYSLFVIYIFPQSFAQNQPQEIIANLIQKHSERILNAAYNLPLTLLKNISIASLGGFLAGVLIKRKRD